MRSQQQRHRDPNERNADWLLPIFAALVVLAVVGATTFLAMQR